VLKLQEEALFVTPYNTGMRLGELCGLKWDRVNFELQQLSITRTRDRHGLNETTKTKTKRIIPMTQEVVSLLLQLYNVRKSDFVFCKNTGDPIKYGYVNNKLKRDQKRANIIKLISFHDLRHTFATQFMMNGGNVFELQKILGHKNIDMTMRYAHFSPEHLQSATKNMSMGINLEIQGNEPYMNPKIKSNNVITLISKQSAS